MPYGLNFMTLVLFNDHMKDHSSGCTFGGCADYSMTEQTVWRSELFDTGLGLYTSNEWPSPLYVSYRAIGSCVDYHGVYDNDPFVFYAVCSSFRYDWVESYNPACKGLFDVLVHQCLRYHAWGDVGSLAHYHQSGNNTVSRVGNVPSGSGEAGVFHDTTAAEQAAGNHGEGTAYCGLVVYSNRTEPYDYRLSTGIGEATWVTASRHVASDCLSRNTGRAEYAYCHHQTAIGNCPRGWGNYRSYLSYLPGCYDGTYYPSPTLSSTDTFTGSLQINCARTRF